MEGNGFRDRQTYSVGAELERELEASRERSMRNQFDRDANVKCESFPFERFRFFSPSWRCFVACVRATDKQSKCMLLAEYKLASPLNYSKRDKSPYIRSLLERFVPNLTKLYIRRCYYSYISIANRQILI